MKYLVLNGSPHKGNTWKLVQKVVDEVKRQDNDASIKEIHLMELQLPFCIGCSNCFRKGMEFCPHFEKVNQVHSAMEEADGLILCSTTYNMRETALLKNLFDHFCYMMHRPHFFQKKALFITTVGGYGAKGAVKSVCSTLRAIGYNKCFAFNVASISWNAYVPREKELCKLQKMTNQFVTDVSRGKMYFQKSEVLIPYNIFRGMCRYYVKGSEFETADGIYWTDRERAHRAYDKEIPLHLYQRVLGGFFCTLGKMLGKKMVVTYRK